MTTEERVALLEGSLATLNRVLSAQELHNRDMDHNMTILLGIASEQQLDGKAMKVDLGIVSAQIAHIESRLDEHTLLLREILARLPAAPDQG